MAKDKDKIDEDLQQALKDIVIDCEKEDDQIRRSQVKNWKKYEEFWHGVQFLFWNEREQTWISPQTGAPPNLGFSEEEIAELGPFYDFVIDIFTGHGQSIIAALAAQLPTCKFLPDDADSDEDVDTAKTYDKLTELVARHNNAKLLFMRSLFFFWINGFVASYRYVDADMKYGTYVVPVYEEQEITTGFKCPNCGAEIVQTANEPSLPITCEQCGESVEPAPVKESMPIKVRDEEKPKSRVKAEVYGPLFVKVPYYAITQDDCGYLGLYLDKPKSELITALAIKDGKLDEDLVKKIESTTMNNMDRWIRYEFSYPSGPEVENKGLSTIIQYWLRPSAFYRHKDISKAEKLREHFPEGCKVLFVGRDKIFVSAESEKLDERWTLGQAGLSTFIHSDPWCRPIVQIQEMRNQFDNMFMDTFEHGIPCTFADSSVLDFDAYGKYEALPGYMVKAKAPPGKSLQECFYQEQKASIPREALAYRTMLDKDAQFCVGSFPSLYGGPSEGKSRTFSEYNASRQQALQRLQISWQFTSDFWRRNMEQMVRMYAGMMLQDEHFTKREGNSYINVWIRKSQMAGKVGGVESEASDAFPMSLQQKQAFLTKFIELNNPQVNAALYAPENRDTLQNIFAMNEFKMPGSNQFYKQTAEINQMLRGEEVPIDPDIDDDGIHIVCLKNFMTSSVGLDVKRAEPEIWTLLLMHLRIHQLNMAQKMAKSFEETPPGVPADTAAVSEAGGTE